MTTPASFEEEHDRDTLVLLAHVDELFEMIDAARSIEGELSVQALFELRDTARGLGAEATQLGYIGVAHELFEVSYFIVPEILEEPHVVAPQARLEGGGRAAALALARLIEESLTIERKRITWHEAARRVLRALELQQRGDPALDLNSYFRCTVAEKLILCEDQRTPADVYRIVRRIMSAWPSEIDQEDLVAKAISGLVAAVADTTD
jgi:hypothetical protein